MSNETDPTDPADPADDENLSRRLALELAVDIAVANRQGRPHEYIQAAKVVADAAILERFLAGE